MKVIFQILYIFMLFITTSAQDPTKTDGDNYKVILENEKVRVLKYHDTAGQKTNQHHHPDFIMYALSDFTRKLIMKDGRQITRELKKGDVIWMQDQVHTGENIGKTDTRVLIIEMKGAH